LPGEERESKKRLIFAIYQSQSNMGEKIQKVPFFIRMKIDRQLTIYPIEGTINEDNSDRIDVYRTQMEKEVLELFETKEMNRDAQ
jgi:hypothetical protein